LSHFSKIKII